MHNAICPSFQGGVEGELVVAGSRKWQLTFTMIVQWWIWVGFDLGEGERGIIGLGDIMFRCPGIFLGPQEAVFYKTDSLAQTIICKQATDHM